MKVNLKYPVFAFLKGDNMIYVFFNERDIKSTNTEIFNTMQYENITQIDSTGNVYKIKRAFKVKYLGLWGFNPLLKGRQILIDYEYAPEINTISLNDFKNDLLARIDKTKKIWRSAWDIQELKGEVIKCSTFEELAELLK